MNLVRADNIRLYSVVRCRALAAELFDRESVKDVRGSHGNESGIGTVRGFTDAMVRCVIFEYLGTPYCN